MIYAREVEGGPILTYAGTAAIVPDGYIILDKDAALKELEEDAVKPNETLLQFQAEIDALLNGAHQALVLGIALTPAQATAIGARPSVDEN